MDNQNKKNSRLDAYVEALAGMLEHANQDKHIPECPFYKGDKEKSKEATSSGAVSNAYRNGWDVVFGRGQIGKA